MSTKFKKKPPSHNLPQLTAEEKERIQAIRDQLSPPVHPTLKEGMLDDPRWKMTYKEIEEYEFELFEKYEAAERDQKTENAIYLWDRTDHAWKRRILRMLEG